jgi:methylated-DNA-[protein]-cysteine S-methyltransferase
MREEAGMCARKNPPVLWIGSTQTSLGEVWVAVSDAGLAAVEIGTTRQLFAAQLNQQGSSELILDPQRTGEACAQIRAYLAGERTQFDLQLDWSVLTEYQAKVLAATYAVPYGSTLTYGELAAQLGNPRAARAVGRAEATNPIPLVLPCHRIVGQDGSLRGYGTAAGVETKAWLLELESSHKV